MAGLQERVGDFLRKWKARLPGRPGPAKAQRAAEKAPEKAHPVLVVGGQVAAGGKKILSDLQFLVPQGRLAALVGDAGSGKTALLETLAGVRLPAGGRVLLFGLDPARASRQIRAKAAYVPSTPPRRPGWTLKRYLFHQGALCGLTRQDTEKRIR
ncbi:MAG TPA: ATP-binding cassette domain-containing protein, partial [Planctomycetes bacterium]|nr:ATP-binding cassette domain-containing protein [Planctomycetota bacterium]